MRLTVSSKRTANQAAGRSKYMGKRNRGKQALGIFLAGWMAATSVDISALTTYAA